MAMRSQLILIYSKTVYGCTGLTEQCIVTRIIHVHILHFCYDHFVLFLDGRMTVSPSLSFHHENRPVDLVYRFESEKIDIGRRPFQENFTVTSHGELIMHGYANAIHIGKPYVDLKVKVDKPGSYLGTITGSSSSATAVIKQMKGK